MRLFIANIGWMMDYKGQSGKDKISGGGSYTNKNKHEVYNFQNNGGYCYGYVESHNKKPRLSRIDKGITETNKISDVLVVWVAPNESVGGSYIVGWYKNATIYSTYQNLKDAASMRRSGYAYNIKAKAEDCTLLPVDARTFKFLRGSGYLGQTNYCYLDSDNDDVRSFRKTVIEYVKNCQKNSLHDKHRMPKPDSELNKRIEKAAVDMVIKHYKSLGYDIEDRQKDNIGWDLEAKYGEIELHLEVKGNASAEAFVRISRNEYKAMMKNRDSYRLCVVTNALKSPQLYVFASEDTGEWTWEEDSRLHLKLDEQIAAIGQFDVTEL